MIRYVYARHLCRKAVARAFHGRIMKGKSPLPEFPVCIEIEPRVAINITLLTCARKKRDAHPKDASWCDCQKNTKLGDHQTWAFVVPLDSNTEVVGA